MISVSFIHRLDTMCSCRWDNPRISLDETYPRGLVSTWFQARLPRSKLQNEKLKKYCLLDSVTQLTQIHLGYTTEFAKSQKSRDSLRLSLSLANTE